MNKFIITLVILTLAWAQTFRRSPCVIFDVSIFQRPSPPKSKPPTKTPEIPKITEVSTPKAPKAPQTPAVPQSPPKAPKSPSIPA
jgi:hypothetical protein